jgi:hypothetical protein
MAAFLAKEMVGEDGMRVVTTLHGTDVTLVGTDPSYRAATRFALMKSQGITAVSRYLAQKTSELCGSCADIDVIYNFIDPSRYTPAVSKTGREAFANDSEVLLLHMSNFRPVKRVADVIRIFEGVHRVRPARLVLLGDGPDENSTDEQEALLLSAMDGWFISDEAAAEEDEPLAFWDEHGLDAQRGYQIACLLIGSDPDYFSDLAENLEIPEERVDSCIEEQQKVADSWHAVLSKHMLTDNERPKGKVTVTYGAAHGDLAIWPGILRRWGLAEQVAADLSKNFRLPRDLKLEYAECDEANAWWDPETDTLTVCYEILDEYTYFAKL